MSSRLKKIWFLFQSDPSRFAALKRSAESGRLEILALENQLLEQERCHLEQVRGFIHQETYLIKNSNL